MAEAVAFSARMDLTRAGKFTLRITVADEVAGKKATFDAPLSITLP